MEYNRNKHLIKLKPHRKRSKLFVFIGVILLAVVVLNIYHSKLNSSGENREQIELSNIPPYSGEAFVEINGNIPTFMEGEKVIRSFERYSDLDYLGRCGLAYANLSRELMPTEERGAIGSVKPTGWHTVKYNDLIDGNYLYNRCHLIAYCLAGENANERNLITGTRYLNVTGMLPFEMKVCEYIENTGNHVLYRVTPIFEDENLVASGVQIEAWSVEDNGEGISFHVYCYNVQPGIGINYKTGESWVNNMDTDDESIHIDQIDNVELEETEQQKDVQSHSEILDLIINTNKKKIHLPECPSVNSISEHNKKEYTGKVQELVRKGYSPCKRCLSDE